MSLPGPNPATLDYLFSEIRESGHYFVDSLGRVWSNYKQGKGKFRDPVDHTAWHRCENDNGYGRKRLTVRGRKKTVMVSRFVYWWFNGDIPDGYDVDHKDDDKSNDHPDNLQLLTPEDNWEKTAWKVRTPGWKVKGQKITR